MMVVTRGARLPRRILIDFAYCASTRQGEFGNDQQLGQQPAKRQLQPAIMECSYS